MNSQQNFIMQHKLTLPKAVARPFDMATDRARLFVDVGDSLKSHPVIGAHVREVLGSLDTHSPKLPPPVVAAMLSLRGEFGEAMSVWKQAYEENPTDPTIAYRYADALADAAKDEELAKFVPNRLYPFTKRPTSFFELGRTRKS